MSPDPLPFHPRRTASDERAYRFMIAQYRALLRRRCVDLHGGNQLALAREIVSDVYGDEAAAAA